MGTKPAMGVEGGKALEEKEKLFCRIFLPLAWSGHIGLGLALGESLEHLAIIIQLLEYVVPSLLLLSCSTVSFSPKESKRGSRILGVGL